MIREKWVSREELFEILGGDISPSGGINFTRITGLTAGSIPFADATGHLSEDNAALFWDLAEDNLGIGTSTFSATMTQGIQIKTGAAPTANVADSFAFYSADFAGGNACPHFRTENGTVIGLNQSLFTTDSPTFAALTVGNLGLHILDTGGDHYLTIKPNEDLSASRVLSIVTGDAARTITLSGNPTLADWFDQPVKQASSPTFASGVTIGNLTLANGSIIDSGGAISFGNENIGTTGSIGAGVAVGLRKIHARDSNIGSITLLALENTDTTNNNTVVYSFRTATTGAGADSFVEMGAMRCKFLEHNHATKASEITLHSYSAGSSVETLKCRGSMVIIPDAGTIGSASDTDAIQIEADGDVVLTQDLGVGITPAKGKVHVYNVAIGLVTIEGATAAETRAAILNLEHTNRIDRAEGILITENGNNTWFYGEGYDMSSWIVGYHATAPELAANAKMTLTTAGALTVVGCVADGTCEIMKNEDALAIIDDILKTGSGKKDEYDHERMDMKKIHDKYPFMIQEQIDRDRNKKETIKYFDKLGAKSDLIYVAIRQLNEKIALLEAQLNN